MSPVAPTIVADQPVRGATAVVTAECSAPASTVKVIDWPPTSYEIVGSWGRRIRELGLPYSDSAPARLIRFCKAGLGWYLSVLGRLNFLDPLDVPLRWGHSFFQCLVSGQWAHWSGLEVVSSSFPLSTWEQPVSLDLSSSLPLLAGLLPVAFFLFVRFTVSSASCWTSWFQFTKTLFATSRSRVAFVPAKPSSYWSCRCMSAQDSASGAVSIG